MIDSVLKSIKKPLNVADDDNTFDEELIMHINSVFSTLYSIGASPKIPFFIEDDTAKWSEFIGDINQAQMVKSYMALKVRLAFDPPATSFTIDAMSKMANEWEWRLSLLEFAFDPDSKPVNEFNAERDLALMKRRVSELEDQVVDVDQQVDDVPDLTQVFKSHLER